MLSFGTSAWLGLYVHVKVRGEIGLLCVFFLELFSLEIFVGSKEYVKKLKKKKKGYRDVKMRWCLGIRESCTGMLL